MVIGAALREETEVDPRFGGWLNADLAGYIVRVNADIRDIDVSFVDRPDPLLNAVGSKGWARSRWWEPRRPLPTRSSTRRGRASARCFADRGFALNPARACGRRAGRADR
jgi:hypothetical protein